MGLTAGVLIYLGFVPLVKIAITLSAGFVLVKKGLLPPMASRGASHISMDVGLPCLVFSSIVPSFNSSNIARIGPLCMSALLYQIIGAVSVGSISFMSLNKS